MPSPLSYRPHYHRDWVSSTTVRCMSYAAIGIYLTLLDAQWEDGFIPEDPREMLKCKAKEWKEFAPFLEKCFPLFGGERRNAKCHEQREEATQKVLKNRANASIGGKANTKRNGSERLSERSSDGAPIPDTDTDTQLGITPLPPKGGAAWVEEVIGYLNAKTGKRFTTRKGTVGFLNARYAETPKDLKDKFVINAKLVIDHKCSRWLGTDQAEYLRPETLFASSHWESYLMAAEAWDRDGRPSKSAIVPAALNGRHRETVEEVFERLSA